MEIEIQIVAEKIVVPEPDRAADGAVGAWVEFTGRVRGQEDGQAIAGLVYEAYQPMAEQGNAPLAARTRGGHPCLRATVIHRIGAVPVGEAAIYLGVAGAHRAGGICPCHGLHGSH